MLYCSNRGQTPSPVLRVLGVLCLLASLCLTSFTQPEQKQLTIYTPLTSYSLPVLDRDGTEYVGLAEVLEPLGKIAAKLDGKKWKLRFNDREAEFQVGKNKARVNKQNVELTAPFIAENGRGYIPVRSLTAVIAALVPEHVPNFHESSRRLFLDKTELHYTAELRKGNPTQVVLTFSAPVNPFVATEPGKLRMVFRREPLIPSTGGETVSFDDKFIPSLAYSESNGTAELAVSATTPLSASFSGDRKTITLSTPLQTPMAQTQPQPIPPLAAPAATKPAPPAQPKFVVMIDAAHGGDDPGGAITDKLSEKDVDLTFARRLAHEFEARGIAAHLLRDSDTTMPTDQRAVITNAATPFLYVAVHAAGSGNGVRVFTARLAQVTRTAAFLPWDTAQAMYVGSSHEVANAISTELLKHDIPSLTLDSSVHPLENIAAPALAIEVAAPANGKLEDLTSGQYQQSVASAIVSAVASARGRLPHGGATP